MTVTASAMTIRPAGDGIWEIPASEKPGMLVPARLYASEKLLAQMDAGVFEQVTNVACLPGIVRAALCMPDGHWGYGFPIGGVAAFRADTGVISPGGIGFDINCGMRLIRTGLTEAEVLAHCRIVAREIPLIGFYLQPAVGGRVFSYDFWRRFADIPELVAIKMAPFNRYQTLDVVRAICESGRDDGCGRRTRPWNCCWPRCLAKRASSAAGASRWPTCCGRSTASGCSTARSLPSAPCSRRARRFTPPRSNWPPCRRRSRREFPPPRRFG